jgi:hypothetical protein
LADALAAEPSLARSARLGEELAPGMRAFAESELRQQIVAADEAWRDMEFLFAGPADGENALTLQGRLDVLWRDAAGWHLLAWDFAPPIGRDHWHGRKPGLMIQAWAVQRQVDAWPRNVSLFNFARGTAVTDRPREPAARMALRTLLTQCGNATS